MTLSIAFRVDGSPMIGSGHVMRCLTLADGFARRECKSTFVMRAHPDHFADRVSDRGYPVRLLPENVGFPKDDWLGETKEQDYQQTLNILKDEPPDWLICDHYSLDDEWQKAFRTSLPDTRILVIDDLADRKHDCDILVDPSAGRSSADYERLTGKQTQILAGIDFALLRPEFAASRKMLGEPAKQLPDNPSVLITLGGGKTEHHLRKIGQALSELRETINFSTTVIGPAVSADFPNNTEVMTFSDKMAKEIASSDLLICAAGGTSWERCCLGKPGIVIPVADNQSYNSQAIENAGTGIVVSSDPGEISHALSKMISDAQAYADMASKCWNWCDGLGTVRVVSHLLSRSMELVPCAGDDARFVYDARYSGGAERFYRNPERPSYEQHQKWFVNALSSTDYALFLVCLGNRKIAHVRLDRESEHTSEIGIALSADERGKGLSVPVLLAACEYCRKAGISRINAEVHADNRASRNLFENAGFKPDGMKSDVLMSYVLLLDPVSSENA